MTASYDGVLTVTHGHIEPCCEQMHRAVYARVIYLNSSGRIAVRMPTGSGQVIIRCPWCGAEVGA